MGTWGTADTYTATLFWGGDLDTYTEAGIYIAGSNGTLSAVYILYDSGE